MANSAGSGCDGFEWPDLSDDSFGQPSPPTGSFINRIKEVFAPAGPDGPDYRPEFGEGSRVYPYNYMPRETDETRTLPETLVAFVLAIELAFLVLSDLSQDGELSQSTRARLWDAIDKKRLVVARCESSQIISSDPSNVHLLEWYRFERIHIPFVNWEQDELIGPADMYFGTEYTSQTQSQRASFVQYLATFLLPALANSHYPDDAPFGQFFRKVHAVVYQIHKCESCPKEFPSFQLPEMFLKVLPDEDVALGRLVRDHIRNRPE